MKITVVGMGYVGLSNAVLLSQHHEVVVLDISSERVEALNSRRSPIDDQDIRSYLSRTSLNLRATTDKADAYRDAAFVLIATPTNYDPARNAFDTKTVEHCLAEAAVFSSNACAVIKSTVPVGFTASIQRKTEVSEVFFSPEFLREGKALHDNLYPSRIVVGSSSPRAKQFAGMLAAAANRKDVPILHTGSTEAEAIKLFANAYLAMRVAFFNELDTYSAVRRLSTREIIEGVGLDPRVGSHYNNPSFGYGGYCLPKDSKQLLADFADIPQSLIQSIVTSNTLRKRFIADEVVASGAQVVGVHRLIMKAGSDNFRESSIQGVIELLQHTGTRIIIHEPGLTDPPLPGTELEPDLGRFKQTVDIILTNRMSPELEDTRDKVYTRDLYGSD